MTEINLTIREALPTDAEQLLALMDQVGSESEFLVMDEQGLQLSPELLAHELAAILESSNNSLLVALDGEQLIASASLRASSEKRVAHIGELGISIVKAYWGLGLGTILVEELLLWAEESQVLRRIELTVQKQNTRAVHLYQKFGFETEAVMARGARGDDGRFLDVLLMSRMID